MSLQLNQESVESELLQILEKESGIVAALLLKNKSMFSTLTPSEVINAYLWKNSFSDQEQAILSYYRPFAAQIKQDLDLGARCLSSLLLQKITIMPTAPFWEAIKREDTLATDHGQCDVVAYWGGQKPVEGPCFEIIIGPMLEADIPDFLPGGKTRQFLDQGLCPLFLPQNSRWKLSIIAHEVSLIAHDECHNRYWNISSKTL